MDNNDHIQLLLGIDGKVDEMREKLHSIELTQTRIESDLKYHIKRTDLLEDKIMDIDASIKPIENATNAITGVGKIIAFFMGIIMAVLSLFRFFKKN
jgi:hypothetical protein